jgi:hypothetical protein
MKASSADGVTGNGKTNGNGLGKSADVIGITSQPLVQIKSSGKRSAQSSQKVSDHAHTIPPPLIVCRGCHRYVKPDTSVCPHCDGDMTSLTLAYEKKVRTAQRAMRRLLKHLPAS